MRMATVLVLASLAFLLYGCVSVRCEDGAVRKYGMGVERHPFRRIWFGYVECWSLPLPMFAPYQSLHH